MIPNKIHYCWFGPKQIPKEHLRYIESWSDFFPGYEIILWNESNFDVNSIKYTKEAYSAGMYAFVSDFARLQILYEHGGLYLDTDVEILKSFQDIIDKGAYMGSETTSIQGLSINPGLGFACEPQNPSIGRLCDSYRNDSFIMPDGSYNKYTIVERTSDYLKSRGLTDTDTVQKVDGLFIYPSTYFSPMNPISKQVKITSSTRTYHHYAASWFSWRSKLAIYIRRCFGERALQHFAKIYHNFSH